MPPRLRQSVKEKQTRSTTWRQGHQQLYLAAETNASLINGLIDLRSAVLCSHEALTLLVSHVARNECL